MFTWTLAWTTDGTGGGSTIQIGLTHEADLSLPSYEASLSTAGASADASDRPLSATLIRSDSADSDHNHEATRECLL